MGLTAGEREIAARRAEEYPAGVDAHAWACVGSEEDEDVPFSAISEGQLAKAIRQDARWQQYG